MTVLPETIDEANWLTPSRFAVRFSQDAEGELSRLPPATQERFREMLNGIAELAELMPRGARAFHDEEPLHLHFGGLSVRYSIDELARTLGVTHIFTAPEDAPPDR